MITQEEINDYSGKFPKLAPGYVLRELESLLVYEISRDEFYELDEEAFEFLKKCNGRNRFSDMLVNSKRDKNIDFMLDEGIIQMTDETEMKTVKEPLSWHQQTIT